MPKVGKKRKSAAQRSAHQEKGDNQQSQPAGIMNLSTELRFQILQDLVPEDCVLEIHSLPEKRERTSTSRLPAEARLFMGLRLVNRAFYEEASTLFYTRNRFCISNGKYGSTKTANIQALQNFIACIPSRHIAQIRHLGMPLYLQELGYTNIYRGDGTRSLARCTIKEFTGVTNLLLYVPHYHPHSWYAHKVENKWRLLIRDDRMLDFFRSLLEHKNLKEIIASIVLDNDEVKDALQSIVNTSEAAGGIVVSQKVNFIRQRPWGLKGIGKC